MKWLIACLLALCMVAPAMAGEDPFVAIVGNDSNIFNGVAGTDISATDLQFYFSPKELQFFYEQSICGVQTAGETFIAPTPIVQPEICDSNGQVVNFALGQFTFTGEPNAVVRKQNGGTFVWKIRLPKKPNAINLCIQCGVLKPDTFRDKHFEAILDCAAYTGERVGSGFCTRDDVAAGQNPVDVGGLPLITATVSPGQYNAFQTFHLTAYRNPSTYNGVGQPMQDGTGLQILNGSPGTRIMLKSCFDKCINIKLPVTGQQNALGETEQGLELDDLITISMAIPDGYAGNTVDIYCSAISARLKGIGEGCF